ncbi:hypothetical protein acsn021_37340 [Anaerocolumna cellulosilytica]|uniref:Carrier domain-containing protein n=2 Tax=Anaerocolumna cellulosilytica TaxID=433286 RepID=A0A6S6RAR8_9FIRM|nr:hypothetical protein acsn021_37340 [Anaerocolumna cellulosilytica]
MINKNSNLSAINKYILALVKNGEIKEDYAYNILKAINNQGKKEAADSSKDIAIIGVACHFPDADNVETYWKNLLNEVHSVKRFPENRLSDLELFSPGIKNRIKNSKLKAGYLEEIFEFDASYFRISPKEASFMDPIQRMFLQTAFEAIEDSGYGGRVLKNSNTGVFVGLDTTSTSLYRSMLDEDNILSLTGALTGIIASRISYILDLHGPAMVVDTACSSGLVAIHDACSSLRNDDCKMAIAGGINIIVHPSTDVGVSEIESSSGKLRAFDRNAGGTLWGEGVGALILKPLDMAVKDGDNIYAVIKGSSVNNDGASNGITAPNVTAQIDVIINAWKNAGVNPESIRYIETHGTGTLLGDPVEIKGITEAFRKYTSKKQFCGIGSVKSNIGHTVAASGVASLLKVSMILKNKLIPSAINFDCPNTLINFDDSPVYVVNKQTMFEVGSVPLRAGVSAFGFSGTNCHIVLEDAPSRKNQDGQDCIGDRIFTISAASKSTLLQLLERYCSFLNSHKSVDVKDLCYTIKTARPHYSYRVVILFNKKSELRNRLKNAIDIISMEETTSENIFYGWHRIIHNSSEVKNSFEITEEKKKELNKAANKKLNLLASQSIFDNVLMKEICLLYTQGADIDWEMVYPSMRTKIGGLPLYPFEKKKHIVKPSKNVKEVDFNTIDHYLLDNCLAVSMQQDIYVSTFSLKKDWVLNEHRIAGRPTVPGVTYLEIVRAVAENYFPNQSIELRNVVFMTPLYIESDEIREVQTVIYKDDVDYLEFKVISRQNHFSTYKEEKWITHVTGKILSISSNIGENYDIEQLKTRLNCQNYSSKIDLNNPRSISTEIFDWGPRWDNLKEIYTGEEVLLELELPAKYAEDLRTCWLHPALMDNAANWVAFNTAEGVHLPLMYSSLKIYGRMPIRFYAYITRTYSKDEKMTKHSETLNSDILLLDENGKVFAFAEQYVIKRVHNLDMVFNKQVASKSINMYHTIKWIEDALLKEKVRDSNGSILVINGHNSLSHKVLEGLYENTCDIIEVEIGESYCKVNNNLYKLNGSYDEYLKLVDDVKARNISRILHMASTDDYSGSGDIENLKINLNKGIYSMYYLVKALMIKKLPMDIKITVVSNYADSITGDEKEIRPYNSSLVAFMNVVRQEYPTLRCRSIDIDEHTKSSQVLNEIIHGKDNFKTAYRNGKRYIEKFQEIDIDVIQDNDIQISDSGVYVITGGTGGIGLEIGEYFASKKRVKLVLLNRSVFPSREKWREILKKNENTKLCSKIKKIQAIEATGTTVIMYSVDISDEKILETTLDDIRSRYGKIRGVVHSAGVAGEKIILTKDENRFNEVLKPKIDGTWLLDKLTSQDNPDFFVMFSSTSSFLGGVGQGDYAAANSYLDSYAAYRSKKGGRTLTINWPAWDETGMAVDYGVNKDNVYFKGISTRDAIDAFEKVLGKDIQRVIVAAVSFDYETLQSLETNLFKISDSIITEVKKHSEKGKMKSDSFRKVKLKGRVHDDYTKLEKEVSSIWSYVLGVDELDIYEDFYSLGGDSIQAIQIANLIKDRYIYSVDIADVFEYPTIERFSNYIEYKNTTVDMKNGSSKSTTTTQELEVLSDSQVDISAKVPDITDVSFNKEYRLSSTQRRMWFLQNYDPEITVYNLSLLRTVNYELDTVLIKKSVNALILRHTILRTIFKETKGTPTQIIVDKPEIDIQVIGSPDNKDGEILLKKIIAEENKKPFDLSKIPMKIRVIKMDKTKSYIYINIHHIITDGWSIEILFKELIQIYDSYKNNLAVSVKPQQPMYVNWAEMQNDWLESTEAKLMEEYWVEELSKPLPILNFPADFVRPQLQTYNGSFIKFVINAEQTKKFREMSKRNTLTPYMLMLATYFLLLKKITLDDDIIVGFPIAGRDDKQFENVMGLFINTLCIRINFKEIKTVDDLLKVIKEKCIRAYRNGKYPFDMVVSKVNPERDLSRSPVFSAMYQFYDNIPPEMEELSQYEISLLCRDLDDEIEVRIEYNTDLFKRGSIEYIKQYFVCILTELLQDQHKDLSSIQLLSESEKALLIKQFSAEEEPIRNATTNEMFEEQANKRPDSIALISEYEKLTYKELNNRANQIANLLRKQGVLPDTPVGIMTGRGTNTITGILGILKAGGTYIPIDPGFPVARINYMICHSGMRILLTETQQFENVSKLLEEENNLETLFILNGRNAEKLRKIKIIYTEEDVAEQSTENLPPVNTGNSLMYIIYTSGSTGLPKGVMVTHSNAVNYINWSIKDSKICSADKMMLVTSVSFDISVFEIFGALLSGASLYIVSEERISNTELLLESIKKEQLTIWHSVPTLIRQVLMIQKQEKDCGVDFSGIRRVMIGGEAWSVELAKSIRENFTNAEVINMYGPTEATIWVTSYKVNDEIDKLPRIPIGKPIDNNKILILDDNMKLCPVGVEGDIYISGANVTPGYYRDEEKTAEAFSNFDETGERIYKTGDKGRYLSNGNVDYLGRNDGMTKVRGYRIEIGEIESVMLEYDSIKEVAVIGKKAEESSRLVCFYVTDEEQPIDRIRKHLQSKLPEYMIPSQFIHLDHIPLTPNGKIDRKTLSSMEVSERPLLEHEYVRPVTEIETFLADIWQSLLNTKLVGVHDNFFAIGGDSFLANRMYARIEEKYPGEVAIVDIFTYPTIAKLSGYIQAKNVTDGMESSQRIAKEMESLFSDMEKGEIDIDEAVRKINKMN